MAGMINTYSLFKYKTIKGPLHKAPALLKLILLLPLSIFCMSLSPLYLAAGVFAAAIAASLCRFTLREQLTDIKPAVIYSVLMYTLSVFSNLSEHFGQLTAQSSTAAVLIPRYDYLRVSLRLVLIVQISALLFRTTSALELRDAFWRIFPNSRLMQNIAVFLSFIPEVFINWSIINMAWKARGGKQGPAMIKTVVFILISLNMEKAAVKAKALAARSGGGSNERKNNF
jgi:energy-coupling factor transporter transmembrane protein EcfT